MLLYKFWKKKNISESGTNVNMFVIVEKFRFVFFINCDRDERLEDRKVLLYDCIIVSYHQSGKRKDTMKFLHF